MTKLGHKETGTLLYTQGPLKLWTEHNYNLGRIPGAPLDFMDHDLLKS